MPRRVLRHALPPLLFLGLAVLLFHNAWAAPSSTTVGVRGDADATIWYHAWTRYAVAHRVSPLLSDYLNYPDGINLTWQTAQPLTGLASWPIAAAAGPYAAYNVLATVALALSAWCAYVVIRRWVPRPGAAFAGALLYGFSPYMAAHALGHLNLITAFTPPLLLAVADNILIRQRRSAVRSGLLLGALAVVQLFVSEELLATEALMFAAAVVVLLLLHPNEVRTRVAHGMRAIVIAAALFAACASWLLVVQFTGPHHLGGTFQHPGGFSSDLLAFAVPTTMQQVAPDAVVRAVVTHFTGNLSEQTAYLGIPLLLILAVTVWRRRNVAWVRVIALLGLVAALLSMGPTLHIRGHATHLPLPWVIFEHVPVFANVVPSRLMLYAYLAAGLLLAVFVDDVLTAWRGTRALRMAPVGSAALVLAAGVLLLPRFDFPASPHLDPRFFTAGGDAQRVTAVGASVLVAPFVARGDDADPEAWQVLAGMRFRMPSGYFLQPDPADSTSHLIGPVRRPLSQAMIDVYDGIAIPLLTPPLRGLMLDDLRYWRIPEVVVGPMPHRDVMVRLFSELLDRPPLEDQGVELWTLGQPLALRAASAPMSWSYTNTSKRS